MSPTLQLPEGFVFCGTMRFIKAEVLAERAELRKIFRQACTYFSQGWEGKGPHQDEFPHMPITINGMLTSAMIVNMNQHGQLILLLREGVGQVLDVLNEDTCFYVRTCYPEETGTPLVSEQGVMVHCSDIDPDGPVNGNHADAIMAYSYLH